MQTSKRHGLAFDSCENCWLIPYRSSKGSVINLCRYWESSGKKYMTEGLPVGLYGLEALSTVPSRLVFLVEGPFDAIALDHHLRSLKARDRYDILAVPGANTFKTEWAKWLDGRKVRIVYDNDKGGRRGCESVIKRLREAGVKAIVERFNWPTADFPTGCDINDLVKDYEVSIPQFTNEGSEKIDLRKKTAFNFKRGDEIAAANVEWLWKYHIPLGSLVTLDGEQGVGKSTMARAIAARVTAGEPRQISAAIWLKSNTANAASASVGWRSPSSAKDRSTPANSSRSLVRLALNVGSSIVPAKKALSKRSSIAASSLLRLWSVLVWSRCMVLMSAKAE